MRRNRVLVALFLSLLAAIAHAADAKFYRQNVIYFLQHSDVTALIRIIGSETVGEMKDVKTGRVGYKEFRVTGRVLEGFKGINTQNVVFYVTQEQPSDPPTNGEWIVSLNRRDGKLMFADFSVLWVEATPELVAAAREGK